jgi:hypothetical protein
MLTEIFRYLSGNGLATALVCLLWLILFDPEALKRLERYKMKKLMYITILGYFFQLAANIFFIVKKHL